jgi:glycosyltransferase involved in cell wall biosynthesis
MSVIPFGVEVPETIVSPPELPVRICYIKGHRPKYGPDLLLKAVVEVKKAIPDIILSMAGAGEWTEHLKSMALRLGLSDNVQYVGFVDQKQMYSFLQRHHIMVMPSRMEAFGVAALEASACGRPVIASNVGGVPEVVQDGVTGILVPTENTDALAEAVIKLTQDVDLRERMGKAGYEFVKERYSWEKSLDMMCDLYERLIYEST